MSRFKSASFACLVTALFMLASPGNVVGQGGPDPDDVAEEVGEMGNETLARTEEPMPWAPLREAESLLDDEVYAGWVVADPTLDPEVNPDGVEYHFADMSSIPCDAEEAGDEVTITLALHLAFRFPAHAEVGDWRLTGEVLRPLEPDDPDGWVLHGSNITEGHEISATSGTPPLEPEEDSPVSDALAATVSVLIPFNHSANPFNVTSYVLDVSIEAIYLDEHNATAGYARSINATELIVEPCPSSSVYVDAIPLKNVTAPAPPSLPPAGGYGMHEDGVEPIELKYEKQLVDVNGGGVGTLATATVHDWYMIDSWTSPCTPGPQRDGFDAMEEYAEFYYLIEFDGPTRLDIYTAVMDDGVAKVYYWWYGNIPEAGTYCFVSDDQRLRNTYAGWLRGWGVSAAFINGNGGFVDGDAIYSSSYRIDPFAYDTTLDGGSCAADPRPAFETTYSTSDPRVTRILYLHTLHVDRVHTIVSRFSGSGMGYSTTTDIWAGEDGWEVCFVLPMASFASRHPGDWTHFAYDDTEGARYHRFPWQDFTIESSPPGAFSLVGPSDGATVGAPVTFSWTAASDTDGNGVEYELLTKPSSSSTYTVAWSGPETGATLPWPTGTYQWKVHAVNAAFPTAFSVAGPRTFTSSVTDADGDGVANGDDIDLNHDVDMIFTLRDIETDRQLYDPTVVVQFDGPSAPITWTWDQFNEEELRNGYRYSPASTGAIISFDYELPDHATEVPVSVELRARLWPDWPVQRLDINDSPDVPSLGERNCEFTVDTLTGWWDSGGLGERHWAPNSLSEYTNNGFGVCGQDGININRVHSRWHHPFGKDRLFFDIELTDGDGDGIPRDYEGSHSGLSASTDDRYVTSDPDSGYTEEYQDWFLRISTDNPKAGDRLTLTYWLDWTPTAAEEDRIHRQLQTATTQFHALTNGHIWIDKWEEVPDENDARLRIWDQCAHHGRPNQKWPSARIGGISIADPGADTGSYITMPKTFDNCDTGQVRSWEETLYYKSQWAQTLVHELSHYVMWGRHTHGGPENFLGEPEPKNSTGDPKPPHPYKYRANCWTRLSHSASSVPASTIMGDRSGFIQNNDGPGDADRPGPDGRACWHTWPYRSHAYKGHAMCDNRTDVCPHEKDYWFFRENQTLWSIFVERYTGEANSGIVWDFDRTGTGVPASSPAAANTDLWNRFKQYAGPFDPVHRITVVTTL